MIVGVFIASGLDAAAYKMDYARRLLDSGSYNVNEVGLKIGYSTGSHFIAAFKKKFAS